MSQVDVVTKSPLKQRTHGMRSRMETSVRDFEWSWTNAVLFSFALIFFLLMTSAVMPSFWMYFSEQTLGWGGPTDLRGLPEAALRLGERLVLQQLPGPER